MSGKTTRYITEQNQYSDPVTMASGFFNFSLTGSWLGTVTVQRSFDNGKTWLDVATFTSNGEFAGNETEDGVQYRFGVKTAEYTSGTVIGRLGQ